MYLVRNSRSRLIGLDRYRSIEPLAINSGKMLAVEISARISAAHLAQTPITKTLKTHLYQNCAPGKVRVIPRNVKPFAFTPNSANATTHTPDRMSVIQNIFRA